MASQISYLSQSFASRLWLQVYGIPAEALKTTTLVLVLPIQPSRPPPSISTTAPFRSSDEPIELCWACGSTEHVEAKRQELCLVLSRVHWHNRSICFGMTHETKSLSESEIFLESLPNFFFTASRMSEAWRTRGGGSESHREGTGSSTHYWYNIVSLHKEAAGTEHLVPVNTGHSV